MKRKAILFVILIGLMMSGCLVSSLHPFYKMKDKIFDEALIGNWLDTDSAVWIIQPNKTTDAFMAPERIDSTYSIKYYEDKDALSYLQATLFVLNGQKYVDFYPDPDEEHCDSEMTSIHHIPVHTLARMQFNKDTMMFFWFGEEWLNELFENNRVRIDHETISIDSDYHSNILTAETDDLQKFILKYMNDKKTTQDIENAFTLNKEAEEHVFLKLFPYDGPIPNDD
jgi:hypothetical protein